MTKNPDHTSQPVAWPLSTTMDVYGCDNSWRVRDFGGRVSVVYPSRDAATTAFRARSVVWA
jgi:hypothetical protein